MGVLHSCPLAECNDVESAFESVVVTISFGVDDKARTPLRSLSFSSRDLEPLILKSRGSSGEKVTERSDSVTANDFEGMVSPALSDKAKDASVCNGLEMCQSPRDEILAILDPNHPRHEAAIKLQKVYKSFRTRRKLADCAVLVEQSWWKLLDFAELKHSSISFFDIEKHESAMSRWSRARTRAAKVGKGLSKNGKAQKLALQHWLEAIDPRHRYGHNLRFYYVQWLHSKSREPFFYWLDIGEGKEVNLERSPRSVLQQQCIKYLGPIERKAYEVVVEDGKFIYKLSGELVDTTEDAKWIFVLSTSKALYVGKKKKGRFQHSSFLAGGVTIAAGRIIVESGALKAVWPHSGHYRPTEENFRDFLSFLGENNVDMTDVKTSPTDEDEISVSGHRGSKHVRNHSSEEDLDQTVSEMIGEETHPSAATIHHMSQRLRNFGSTLQRLEVPSRDDELVESNPIDGLDADDVAMEASADGYVSEESKGNSVVPQEAILHRISSKKISKSFQLGKQLSCKWTTGAGPRIGCVRDYPTELQFRALEQVNLSPRRTCESSRRCSTPSAFCAEPTPA